MKYRARANREVRELTPSEVTALVPWLYEPIEDEETREAAEPTRDAALLTPEAPLMTQQARAKRRHGS
ncbi:MAG: hypothetical protein JWM95_1696 [Gemmatimonadetes bacterium]|nr:hypothetical protein [Gemmatimonadota bacterium]